MSAAPEHKHADLKQLLQLRSRILAPPPEVVQRALKRSGIVVADVVDAEPSLPEAGQADVFSDDNGALGEPVQREITTRTIIGDNVSQRLQPMGEQEKVPAFASADDVDGNQAKDLCG